MGNRMPGLEKNMREFIVENLTNTEALSVTVILMNNVIALIVAFFIMFTYKLVDCLEKCLIYGHIRRFAD